MNTRADQAETPHPWPRHSHLELGALPSAVPCARLHARQLLWEWGLRALAPDTELVVSELVTNAVKATAGRQQAAVRLRLSADNERVLVEVWDADPQPPVPRDLTEDGQDEGGRGLFLVAALSTHWDWYPTREPPGKVVWCELQALLPCRVRREQEKRPVRAMGELDVLRRVRDRLRELAVLACRHLRGSASYGTERPTRRTTLTASTSAT
jgi:anti-sigma regulatory factor (Ser/Thr protein kinase)